jgi:hypothetical protein
MIRATVRSYFTAGDMSLALELLGASEPERRRLAQKALEEGPDVLWDDPRLMAALLAHRGLTQPTAALFLYVSLRRLLLEAGVDDRAVSDYCASLLLAFGRKDRAWRLGEHDENRYGYLVDLVAEADRSDGEHNFKVRLHLGNFSLWLSGIFPDYIAARRVSKGGPGLPYYEQLGSAGFRMASDHRLADEYGLAPVLRQAADRFGTLRVVLNRLSDRMLFPDHHSAEKLMRQVADDFDCGVT